MIQCPWSKPLSMVPFRSLIVSILVHSDRLETVFFRLQMISRLPKFHSGKDYLPQRHTFFFLSAQTVLYQPWLNGQMAWFCSYNLKTYLIMANVFSPKYTRDRMQCRFWEYRMQQIWHRTIFKSTVAKIKLFAHTAQIILFQKVQAIFE